jgi:hypothetical protein
MQPEKKNYLYSDLFPISKERFHKRSNTGIRYLILQIGETKRRIQEIQDDQNSDIHDSDELSTLYHRLDSLENSFKILQRKTTQETGVRNSNDLDSRAGKISNNGLRIKTSDSQIENSNQSPNPHIRLELLKSGVRINSQDFHVTHEIEFFLKSILTKEFLENEQDYILKEIFPIKPLSIEDFIPTKRKEFERLQKQRKKVNTLEISFDYRYNLFLNTYKDRIDTLYQKYFIPSFVDFLYVHNISPKHFFDINHDHDLVNRYIFEFRLVATALLFRTEAMRNLYTYSHEKGNFKVGKFGEFFGTTTETTLLTLHNQIYNRTKRMSDLHQSKSPDELEKLRNHLLQLRANNAEATTESMRQKAIQYWQEIAPDTRKNRIDRIQLGRKVGKEAREKLIYQTGQISWDQISQNNQDDIIDQLSDDVEPKDSFKEKPNIELQNTPDISIEAIGSQIIGIIGEERKYIKSITVEDIENYTFQSKELQPVTLLFDLTIVNVKKRETIKEAALSKPNTAESEKYYAGKYIESLYWQHVIPLLLKKEKNIIAVIRAPWFSATDKKGTDFVFFKSIDPHTSEEGLETLRQYIELLSKQQHLPKISNIYAEISSDDRLDTMSPRSVRHKNIACNENLPLDGTITNFSYTEIISISQKLKQHFSILGVDVKARKKTLENLPVVFADMVYPIFDRDGVVDINATLEILKKALQNRSDMI